MGSFANTFLRVLLGWVQVAASSIWALVTSSEGESLFAWLGRNYLTLAVLLCIAGMVVDGVVHWFRWRPFEVWRSFFRRIRGQRQEAGSGNGGESRSEYGAEAGAESGAEAGAYPYGTMDGKPTPRRRASRNPGLTAKIKLPAFLKDDDPEGKPITYHPAPPAKPKADAFGKPFYPQGWEGPENSGEASQGGIKRDVSAP